MLKNSEKYYKITNILDQTIYFEILITSEDITSVSMYWIYISFFSLIACSVILFCATSRQSKIKERIRLHDREIQIKTEIKTEYETIEKYLFKTPKKIYIIITVLILTIILLLIKLYKKYVDETF